MTPFYKNGHLRDEALLLLSAGELPVEQLRPAEVHLQKCGLCRTHLDRLQIRDRQMYCLAKEKPLPPATAARNRLKAEIAALHAEPQHRRPLAWVLALLRPAMLLHAAIVVVLLVIAVTFRGLSRPLQDSMAAYEETGPEPDHLLTPGSAVSLTVAEVCRLSDDNLDPPVPVEMQRAVFRAYRMDERAARRYQVDYVINPQLGGDNSLQNLWPEPYHATVWNAAAKDALESRLRGLVCGGQVDLQLAQHELAWDWVAAYKKYFHTNRPTRAVAEAVESARH